LGNLSEPPLAGLVRFLQAKYALQDFVETGTFRGGGTAFAATVFPSVTTIEVKAEYHAATSERLKATGARFLLGDSRVELPKVVAGLAGPALFWLDGHAGGGHFGAADDCPLLEELTAIAASPYENFVLVDDARAFLAPPPPPFDPDKWPELADVLAAIRQRVPYYCVAIADTLFCVPPAAKADMRAFCNAIRPKI
jgi:hypothetical protein